MADRSNELFPKTEDEEEMLLRLKDVDKGKLKEAGLAFDVFYDEEDDLHFGIFPTPKDNIPPAEYLAFVPVKIGGSPIPDAKAEVAMKLTGISADQFHIIGKNRKFKIEGQMTDQAPYMTHLEKIPEIAIEIWKENRTN